MGEHDGQERMSDTEALMWRLEQDPQLSSNVANVTILDRPPDVERLRARLARAADAVPRLRRKVHTGLGAPRWVDDPDFDLRSHVRHLALPRPGTLRQLLDLATFTAAAPFDLDRPLWEFVVVDGLADGRGALVQKLHHTITDGEGAMRLSLQFLDLERQPEGPPPVTPEPEAEPHPASGGPGPLDPLRDLVAGGLAIPAELGRQLRDLLADPASIPGTGLAAAGSVRNLLRQLADTEQARSPLWTARSRRRHLEVLRVPFAPTKAAAKALGGTLNTAFLAAAAAGAGAYHRQLGAPVESLRASMALSTRDAGSEGNAFSLARLDVPTGELAMAERFAAIHEQATAARAGSGANMALLAAIGATLPTSVLMHIARTQTRTVDFATSNVRASSFPLYVAGAKIVENYPIGPVAGVACNLTLLSYAGSLDIGLHVDAGAVTEPARLAGAIEDGFRELQAAGGAA